MPSQCIWSKIDMSATSKKATSYPPIRLLKIIVGACTILFIPLIAQQYTNEVQWSLGDFLAGGILLFLVGFCIDFVLYNHQIHKAWIVVAILFFAFIWAELAVGII